MQISDLYQKAKQNFELYRSGDIPLVLVGSATCGIAAGSLEVMDTFKTEIKRRGIKAEVAPVGCLGLCSYEPLVTIYKAGLPPIFYHHVTEEQVMELVGNYLDNDDPCLDLALGTLSGGNGEAVTIPELPRFEAEQRLVMRYSGYINPEEIEHYLANGGYLSLAKTLAMTSEQVIQEMRKSGLRGRGGAGFITATKWQSCRESPGNPKYVCCNADEGDPGAFMDRVVLESNPHQVLEGMLIAGYAIGSHQGFIYIRSEYPLAVSRLKLAITQAREKGFLGDNIMGSKFSFDISLSRGAGAFVTGEETALIASIEGRRGMPRPRPPYPAQKGLWGKPTAINNVKTLAMVPVIIERGGDWFAGIGTEKSKGTALFALAGKLANTGLAEVPMGTTLKELIFTVGGGIRNERGFKAVQIGGPSGGCLPTELLDTPVDFDSLARAGAMMGSGGIIAMDEDNCIVDTARFFLDFIQKESCGRCTTCRIGTRQMLEIMEEICRGRGKAEDMEELRTLSEDIKVGSLCNLGKTAPNPVLTTLRYFELEYRAHILEKRCPALVCKELIAYQILREKCERSCEHCVLNCPAKAVSSDEVGIKVIDQEKCTKCGTCLEVCPKQYNAVIKVSPLTSIIKR